MSTTITFWCIIHFFFWLQLKNINLADMWFYNGGATPDFANEIISIFKEEGNGRGISRKSGVKYSSPSVI